jgi:hypothetical protein
MSTRSFLCVLLCGVTIWYSCVNHDLTQPTTDLQIHLRWVKNYSSETKEDVDAGILWTLSFLGAEFETGKFQEAVKWTSTTTCILDVSDLGYSTQTKEAWREILLVMKDSEEYRVRGSFDLGRFVMLTLNSTHHYYAITNAKESLDQFRMRYSFLEKRAGVLVSSIAHGNRIVEISNGALFSQVAFIGIEGEGSIEEGDFIAREFEAMDFMPNGQLRFALYDEDGNLKTAASSSLTRAGKPAKCLWCHETKLLPPFDDDHNLSGYWSSAEFKSILADRMSIVSSYRENISTEINFPAPQDHTKAELLYLAFMEPSAERLAIEWGISVDDVKSKLSGLATHPHPEFAFLGEALYHRSDVDQFAPYITMKVPEDAREPSLYEPDFTSQ